MSFPLGVLVSLITNNYLDHLKGQQSAIENIISEIIIVTGACLIFVVLFIYLVDTKFMCHTRVVECASELQWC